MYVCLFGLQHELKDSVKWMRSWNLTHPVQASQKRGVIVSYVNHSLLPVSSSLKVHTHTHAQTCCPTIDPPSLICKVISLCISVWGWLLLVETNRWGGVLALGRERNNGNAVKSELAWMGRWTIHLAYNFLIACKQISFCMSFHWDKCFVFCIFLLIWSSGLLSSADCGKQVLSFLTVFPCRHNPICL